MCAKSRGLIQSVHKNFDGFFLTSCTGRSCSFISCATNSRCTVNEREQTRHNRKRREWFSSECLQNTTRQSARIQRLHVRESSWVPGFCYSQFKLLSVSRVEAAPWERTHVLNSRVHLPHVTHKPSRGCESHATLVLRTDELPVKCSCT